MTIASADDFRALPGRGVEATVAGRQVSVRRPHPDDPANARHLIDASDRDGYIVVVVDIDGVPAGVMAMSDQIRSDAVATVSELTVTTGARPVLLTGDNHAAAGHLGLAMGRTGSDLALETSDAVIVRDELGAVPALIVVSRRARRLVIENLVFAAAVIVGLATWDLVGHLPAKLFCPGL